MRPATSMASRYCDHLQQIRATSSEFVASRRSTGSCIRSCRRVRHRCKRRTVHARPDDDRRSVGDRRAARRHAIATSAIAWPGRAGHDAGSSRRRTSVSRWCQRRKGANRSWTKSASAIQPHRTGPTVTAPMIPWTPCRRNSSMIEKWRQTVRDAAVDAQWDASEDEGATWRKDFDLTFERESRVANG
jgi:hypothetical protein